MPHIIGPEVIIGVLIFIIITIISIIKYPELPIIVIIAIQPLKQYLIYKFAFFQTIDPVLITAVWMVALVIINIPTILKQWKIIPNNILLIQILFASWVLISLFWTTAPIYGAYKGFRLAFLNSLLLFAPFALVRNMASIKRLTIGIFVIGVIVYGKIAFWPSYSVPPFAEFKYFRAGFLFCNDTAPMALYLSGAFCVCGIILARNKWVFSLFSLCLIPLMVGSWNTGYRATVVSIIVSVICAIIVFAKRIRRGIILVVALACVLIIAYFITPYEQQNRIVQGITGVDASGMARLDHYKYALTMFMKNPIGGGIGSYAVYGSGEDTRWFPHNIMLESLSELGIIGFSLLACLFISFLRNVKKYRNKLFQINNYEKRFPEMWFVAWFAVLFASQVTDDLADNRTIWLVMGVTISGFINLIRKNGDFINRFRKIMKN